MVLMSFVSTQLLRNYKMLKLETCVPVQFASRMDNAMSL